MGDSDTPHAPPSPSPSLVDDHKTSAANNTSSLAHEKAVAVTSATATSTTASPNSNGNSTVNGPNASKKPIASTKLNNVNTAAAAAAAPRPRLKPGHGLSTPNMNGPLYMQTSGKNVVLVRRLKRKDEGTWKHLARWFVENQIGLSFNLIALLFLAHGFIPKARVHTAKFFRLSYYNPNTGDYRIGFDDGYLIAFCIVLFTGLRAATMEYVLAPIAKLQGITKRKTLTRFSEQAWLTVYYSVFWTLGVYLYYNSPYWLLNLRELWTNWPNRELDGLMKGYVLIQWAFWLQQMIVIHIEERRKDHWQMFTHHIVTTALISSCYCYHHTRVGNLILVIMDVVDLFLPLAKCLKYSGYQKICDLLFGLFVVSWFVCRHVVYLMVCWSIYIHTPEIIGNVCYNGAKENLTGPFEIPEGYWHMLMPFYDHTGTVCFGTTIKWAFLAPLLFLQVLTIIWFTMIVRVVMSVIRGAAADDVRSDDEAGEEEEDEFTYEEAEPLEEEVGVEELDLRNWERRAGLKRQAATSSGVSLPGHSDRKELLGRIGCEKQVD